MKEGWEVDEGVVEVKRVKVSVGGLRDMVICVGCGVGWVCIVEVGFGYVLLSLHCVYSVG